MRRSTLWTGLLMLGIGLVAREGWTQHSQHEGHGQQPQGQTQKAEGAAQKTTASDKTIVGEVIDPVCFIGHNSKGANHKTCATTCANNGITLAILEDGTERIYLSFPEGHGNPNATLMGYIADHVKVTGRVVERGGLTGILVKSVERVQ